jgi:hypothetical protein
MAGIETKTIYWRIQGVFRRIGTVDMRKIDNRIIAMRIDPQIRGEEE